MNKVILMCVITLFNIYVNSSNLQDINSKEYNPNIEAALALQIMEANLTIYVRSAIQESWNFYVNAINKNGEYMTEAKSEMEQVYYDWWTNFILEYDLTGVTDENLIRQFEIQSVIGTSILNDTQLLRLNTLVSSMSQTYASKICEFEQSCDGEVDEIYSISDVQTILKTSDDYMELAYYWSEWREKTGTKIASNFSEYVQLMNSAARENGFAHAGEMWLYPYLSDKTTPQKIWETVDDLFWNRTFPYYKKLHAYVRWHLESNKDFMNTINDEDNLLPVNILGSVSGQNWQSLYRMMQPYPSEEIINMTNSLLLLNSPQSLFKISEDFYWSIGMEKMVVDYWKNSVFEESDILKTLCFLKSWDFYYTPAEDGDKFRVSTCSQLTEEELIKIHEDMSLTEYQMAYKNQSLIFRRPVNDAIAVGIAGAVGLSVSTPQYLAAIRRNIDSSNKYEDMEYSQYMRINYLFKQALKIIPNLAYIYLVEKWRWNVFKGNISSNEYNYEWWKMSIQIQGVKPPFPRTPEDLDISADHHIGMNSPTLGLFLGNVLQFQIYDKLCKLAEKQDDKYFCNIYGSHLSGHILRRDILQYGASLPWEDQMEAFLGTKEINAGHMIKYFEPLFTYIDEILEILNIEASWDSNIDQVNDYVKNPEEISAMVPIIVGCIFSIMVIIVLIAFCVGQSQQRKLRKKRKTTANKEINVQMEESKKESPKIEKTVTYLDNVTLDNRRKDAEEEIKNALTRSDVESAINVIKSYSSPENCTNERIKVDKTSVCSSENSLEIGKDNKAFDDSESNNSDI